MKEKISLKTKVLWVFLVLAIAFSIIRIVSATTPNPGHSWTDLGNGFWAASNTQTALRTFTFPDSDAIVLTSSSSVVLLQQTITISSTLSIATNSIVYVNAASAPITVTLPSATSSNVGTVLVIKKIDASFTNLVTIVPPTNQTIDGITSTSLANRGESMILQSDGTIWRVLSRRDYDLNSYRIRGTSSTNMFQWYTSPFTGTALGTATLVANTVYAMPLIITHVSAIDYMSVNVTTATGTLMEVGLYNDNGNGYPGALAVDCGNITPTSTTGNKTCTTGLPITLDAGLYWMVVDSNGVTAIRGAAVANNLPDTLGYSSSTATADTVGWKATLTEGAYPATFPTAGSSTITAAPIPAIFVHFSG